MATLVVIMDALEALGMDAGNLARTAQVLDDLPIAEGAIGPAEGDVVAALVGDGGLSVGAAELAAPDLVLLLA